MVGDVDKDKICWAFQPSDCEGNDCEGGGAGVRRFREWIKINLFIKN